MAALLLVLNSCAARRTAGPATEPAAPSAPAAAAAPLPADVTMNQDAGRGGWLFVNLHLQDGQELPFFIDTGTNYTCFDKSLAPRLGKRIGIAQGRHYDDVIKPECYAAPKLFLGDTRLITGSRVLVMDLSKPSADAHRPVMGILGSDCLRHYCVQLDFAAGKLRFLDADRANSAQLGRAFPVTFRSGLPWMAELGLVPQATTPLLIDTGNRLDGALETQLFRSKVSERSLQVDADEPDGGKPRTAILATALWNGETYSSLFLRGGVNSIGLRFLARHLVTLNFPRQTIYLQRISADALPTPGAPQQ